MNEIAFLETMINTLKFDSKFKDKKEKLLPILRRCEINPIPQWAYVQHSGRSGQRYENIEIRVPVPLLDEANREFDDLYALVEYVYEDSEEYGLGGQHHLVDHQIGIAHGLCAHAAVQNSIGAQPS